MKQTAARKPGRPANPDRCERRREEILDAAVTLFAEQGYADADMQVLADRLGVGKGTVYRYFPSKRELFLAAADSGIRRLTQAVEDSMEGIDGPLEQIARGIRAYLTFFAEHPEYVELLIQERAHFKDRKKPTYFEHREANADRWREQYRSLIARGKIRDMAVDRIRDVIHGLVYGTMFTNYFTAPRKSFEEQAQDIIDVVFFGILSAEERRRRGQG